jgi:predicted RNA-binding Zn-ribbon protein involved in translation (DUF1610 family)
MIAKKDIIIHEKARFLLNRKLANDLNIVFSFVGFILLHQKDLIFISGILCPHQSQNICVKCGKKLNTKGSKMFGLCPDCAKERYVCEHMLKMNDIPTNEKRIKWFRDDLDTAFAINHWLPRTKLTKHKIRDIDPNIELPI